MKLFLLITNLLCASVALLGKDSTHLTKRDLTDDEKMLVVDAFRKNPHITLMDIFLDQTSERLNAWVDHPEWLVTKLPKNLFLTAKNVAVELAEDIAVAVKWIGDGIENPKKAGREIKNYWREIKSGLHSLKAMWHQSHRKAMANFVGGFLFYISNHSVEFGTQLVLMLAAGGFVFHYLGEGAEMSFKALGLIQEGTTTGLKSALVGTLWFLHMIDDPLAMLPAFLEPLNQGVAVIKAATNGTTSPIYAFTTPQQESELRKMAFGSTKPYDKMNVTERADAYKQFQNFVCSHSNGTVIIPPEVIPEAKMKDNSIINFKCNRS